MFNLPSAVIELLLLAAKRTDIKDPPPRHTPAEESRQILCVVRQTRQGS